MTTPLRLVSNHPRVKVAGGDSASTIEHKVLVELANARDGLTRRELVRRLYPRVSRPYSTSAQRREELQARKTHERKHAHIIRAALNRLRRKGLIAAADVAVMAAETRQAIDATGFRALRPRTYVECEGDIVGVQDGTGPTLDDHRGRIIHTLHQHPAGLSMAALREKSGGLSKSGRELSAWRRAFREWARAGDIRTADRRQITPKGLQALRRFA